MLCHSDLPCLELPSNYNLATCTHIINFVEIFEKWSAYLLENAVVYDLRATQQERFVKTSVKFSSAHIEQFFKHEQYLWTSSILDLINCNFYLFYKTIVSNVKL